MRKTNQNATENNVRIATTTTVSTCEGACSCCKCAVGECLCGSNCQCCKCDNCQCG